jgi:predicted permease
MIQLFDDLKWALRSLGKTPGFTLLAVTILALGIGANAAIFSLVDRVLLQPLPYPHPERLVAVWETVPERGWVREPFSWPDFQDWQKASTQLEGMAGLASRSMNLTGKAEPERILAGRVSWNFFDVVGVRPSSGRGFLPEEDRDTGPKVVVVSHEFWARRFNQDPGLLGRSLHLDGEDWLVVGIMPKGFHFDHQVARSDIFVPMALNKQLSTSRGAHFMPVVGRLKPGATAASAQAEFAGVAKRLEQAFPGENKGMTARVLDLQDELAKDSRNTLLVLLGAVGFVLLIACANVMNLMLARGARRERETAIRAALGATRWRLMRQALTESAVLGFTGGAIGLMLAQWTMAGFKATLGLRLADASVGLQPRVLGFTFLLALATALLSGLMPALHYQDTNLGEALKEGAKGSGGKAHHRLRGLLVALEMAMATALLIGSGLMLRSLYNLHAVDPGFRTERVLTAGVGLPSFRYPTPEARITFTRNLLRRVADIPGVVAVGANDTLPLAGSTRGSSYDVEGMTLDTPDAIDHLVSPGYFRAMGIPLLQGREFEFAGEGSAIISEAFARRHWKDGQALGHRISSSGPGGPWKTIVGVVGGVRHRSLAEPPEAEMYFSLLETPPEYAPLGSFTLILRTAAAPESFIPALKQALRETDPSLPLGNPRTMAQLVERSSQDTRMRGTLLTAFAILALGLAGVGIYGVISFITGGRTREIGVRMALGAQVGDVLKLVLGQGLRMVLLGLAVGLAVAVALARYMETLMVGVNPRDPATLLGAVTLLAMVGSLACLMPAWRAAQIHPSSALRND